MAEAILSPVIDGIIGNLVSSAIEGIRQAWGVDEEVENLKSTLSVIQAVLEDAEGRQVESVAVKDWLLKLRDVAYDADDVVDEFVIEAQRLELEGGIHPRKRLKVIIDSASSLLGSALSAFGLKHESFGQNIARRMKEIRERLDRISNGRHNLHLSARDGGGQRLEHQMQRRTTTSVVDESVVLGRELDRQEIVEALLRDDSAAAGDVSVISIVGIGGLGKTTLAQLVFNDERVKMCFDLQAWVCVSDDFDVERVTKEIIESASVTTCDFLDSDSMLRCLQETLSGKRFLLVLDDVWNENCSGWEQLRVPLTSGAAGSRVLVTTRSETVPAIIRPTFIYHLKGLSNHDCWSLFTRRAFADGSIDDYPNLLEIVKKVVDKCEGSPLAAKALGAALYAKRDASEWEYILNSEIWKLPGEAGEILPALRLSYHHLPANLKRCFTFCSVYPKAHEFVKDELVQLWIAHGFIHPKEGKRIEGIGSEYFDDLLSRSFFQYSQRGSSYTMHDLIHNLAQSISGNECFRKEHGKICNDPRKVRHLSFSPVSSLEAVNLDAFYEFKSLRTFLVMYPTGLRIRKIHHEIFERLGFLRVLDLNRTGITELPNSIGSLKHLRYLNLQHTKIKRLPKSVGDIHSLQTLNLSYCGELVELPSELRKLINLRHLHLEYCNGLKSMPLGIGGLSYLQTLSKFIVGRERGRSITELNRMSDVHGTMEILKLENVADAVEAQQANLKNKPFLDELKLGWSYGHGDLSSQDDRAEVEVLEGLQPHPNLKQLYVEGYMGTRFPSWMMKMDMLLPNLVCVSLDCRRCSTLPPLGQLPSLKYLSILGIDGLKRIGREICGMGAKGFPLLEKLALMNMSNLEEWCGIQEGDFPCLHELLIQTCQALRQLLNLPLLTLTRLEICDCEGFISLPLLPSLEALRLHGLSNLEEWCSAGEADFSLLSQLVIRDCPKMIRWPCILPVLTELNISECQGFDSLPPFPSIHKLQLQRCNERVLKSVPYLASLSSLTIDGFPQLTSMPQGMLQSLSQLKELEIRNCEELMSLLKEDGLQDGSLPSTLTIIGFYNCPNLKSLPRGLHFLTSLQILEIECCPHLTSLPEEWLPTALQRLEIRGCPLLKARCLKDKGEDWPKISHVPDIWIDYEKIY